MPDPAAGAPRLRVVQDTTDVPPETITVPPDAWDLPRAARFLGVSERTLSRWASERRVPGLIVYDPPKPDAKRGTKGSKPMLAFDPAELARWRRQFTIGKVG